MLLKVRIHPALNYTNRIFLKSCESMDELPSSSVQLTITSPPYWNAIDYDSHVGDSSAEYRERKDVDYRKDYLPFLKRCFSEVLRVHSDGTFCAVVIGTVLYKK
jgi:modification methylase